MARSSRRSREKEWWQLNLVPIAERLRASNAPRYDHVQFRPLRRGQALEVQAYPLQIEVSGTLRGHGVFITRKKGYAGLEGKIEEYASPTAAVRKAFEMALWPERKLRARFERRS
jgi:hypothetical protein